MSEAMKISASAVSAIRNLWNTYQLEKSDSNTEEDEDELARRRQLSINLNQTLRTRQLLINFDGQQPILSLRAPLNLVNVPSISCPRWPIESEVISDVIQHIEWDPLEPEPFYQPTGQESTPMPAEEGRGKVVYCTDKACKQPYFTCSRVGGSRGPIKSATSHGINQTDFTLEFESRFESGNLQKAVQVGDYDYELILRADMYTMKHTQWFYFRVRNMKAGVTYRFTISNLMKKSSLYSHGMKPLLYSERAAKENGVAWQRTGSNITYYRNVSQNAKDNDSDTVTLFSLSWTLQFPHDSDTCYLAHCYPYTYSHLQRYLRCISSNPEVMSYCKVRVLCYSLAGNAVYVVTVTSRGVVKLEGRTKKAVVVTARVHPGETNGSWMMEGFLDFLLGDSDDAQLLRDTFVFKVVPMLNPDGVVVGNYRCSLAGKDLNRNYNTLLRDSYPCVWHTRNMVERLMAEMDVVLYCDFHGHNRKNNVFMYGCNNRGHSSLKLHERVFPLMMSKNASDEFSFKSCKFRVQKSKEGTGRIVMWKLGIKNSYTMEASFGGSTVGNRRGTHFSTRDLKSMGFYLGDTLLDYFDPDLTKSRYCLSELAALLRNEVKERLGKDLGTGCYVSVSDLETSTSGSNSSDSDGLPVNLLNQLQDVHPKSCSPRQTPVKKKKQLKSRKERNQLQAHGVKNNTQPKVLPSSIINTESSLPHDNTVKESIQTKPAERHRKKWQVNGPISKAKIPPATTQPGEVSQVTLWQGQEPVKEHPSTYFHQRTYPDVRTYIGDPVMGSRQGRCSSQLLRLSTSVPPSPNCIHFNHQQLLYSQPCTIHRGLSVDGFSPSPKFHHLSVNSSLSHCRSTVVNLISPLSGLPPSSTAARSSPSTCVKLVPDFVPVKGLLSSYITDKFNSRSILREREFLRGSGRYFVPENSSTSHRNTTKQQNEEYFSKVSPLRCLPFGENRTDLDCNNPLKTTETSSNVLGPVVKELQIKRQCKKTLEDKRHTGILPSLSKSSALMKKELPCPE